MAYVCGGESIYIYDTEKFSKKECYNIKYKIKTNIKDDEDDTIISKPTDYYISGVIPFKEYFLFSKVKEVTIRPATNRGPLFSFETQIVNLKIKENKKGWEPKVYCTGGKAFYK